MARWQIGARGIRHEPPAGRFDHLQRPVELMRSSTAIRLRPGRVGGRDYSFAHLAELVCKLPVGRLDLL